MSPHVSQAAPYPQDSSRGGLLADLTPRETQRNASNPAVSVWVNASAGSGKTTVLTARFLRLLLTGVAPHKILCITFTRAAAAEMANRLQKRLSFWATCSDDALAHELDELQGRAPTAEDYAKARRLFAETLACPGGLRIRTIHAFCQEVLGRFPLEAHLPPHFTVIEEAEAADLREQCLADILRQASRETNTPLAAAVEDLAIRFADQRLLAAVKALLDQRARYQDARDNAGGCEALITRLRGALMIAPDDDEVIIADAFLAAIPRDALRQAAQGLMGNKQKTVTNFAQTILDWLGQVGASKAPTPQEIMANFHDYASLFLTEKGEERAILNNAKYLADAPEARALFVHEVRRYELAYERLEALAVAQGTAAILRLGDAMIDRYEASKAQRAALDFNDLIMRTEKLLRREGIAPWVLFKLDGGLDHILVDEAQDTSRAQWSIIDTLTQEFFSGSSARSGVHRTLFVVGDEKQSIYSFQNADPEAFLAMHGHFAERITAADQKLIAQPLRVSFRSAPAILRAVDHVFADPAAQAGVSREPIMHHAHHRQKIGHVEIWPLQPEPDKHQVAKDKSLRWQEPPRTYEHGIEPQNELADAIADTIKGWLVTGKRHDGSTRLIAPGDIMILLRRRGHFADRMVRALKKRAVPVTGVDRMRLIEQLPVMDMLALAQFALLPDDDLTLAALLRSPLIGFDEDALMDVAIGREGTLWHALADRAAREAGIYKTAHDYLAAMLARVDTVTPLTFFAEALHRPCPGSAISGRHALWQRLGYDALDPLQELLTAAQDFGTRHSPSLQAFLHWLEQTNAEIKREMDSGKGGHASGGQVRIMTVHAAKGLEAPIVFLPDAGGTPRVQALDIIQWHEDAGVALPLLITSKPRFGLPLRLWQAARTKQMEEYRRLFYVAMTRPEQKLIIAGWENKQEQDKDQSWHALALRGLRPLHEEYRVTDAVPDAAIKSPIKPVVVFADPDHAPQTKGAEHDAVHSVSVPLPAWARQALADTDPALDILMPSVGDDDNSIVAAPDWRFARGRIIHRLLQTLPELAPNRRAEAAARYLASPQHNLDPAAQDEIQCEVMGLLDNPAYAALFAPGSRAEVPIIGRLGDTIIPGQVDRLCVVEDEVWIVDYKTNRPPPHNPRDVPDIYRKQMAAYRTVLAGVYPGKTIRCFLLWTYTPLLMELFDPSPE